MTTASRINIRRTAGGVTIRATGAAAQALADAITQGAEAVRQQTLPEKKLHLVVEVMWDGMHYGARTLITSGGDEERSGLMGQIVVSNTDAPSAVVALLEKATPPLKVASWSYCFHDDRGRRLEYCIRAEAL